MTDTLCALYDADALEPVMQRMAREAFRLIPDPAGLVVVGILRRGAPLADRLCVHLAPLYGLQKLERLDLDIKRYADDLTLLFPETRLRESPDEARRDLTGKTVLLGDDVLYQGHSLLRAVEHLAKKKVAAIRTAMLADRFCAVVPVRADIVGLRLEVAPDQIIEARVPPYEPEFALHIVRQPS